MALTSCSDKDSVTENPEASTPLIKEGMELTSTLEKDDVVIEEMTDVVTNLGSTDSPALFYINKSHKLKGTDVPEGKADLNCSFRSLSLAEHLRFIPIFGAVYGFNFDANSTDENDVVLRKKAFYALAQFLLENKIDLSLLISLSNNDEGELKAIVDMADGYDKSISRSSATKNFNLLLNSMLQSKVSPSSLQKALKEEGKDWNSFFVEVEKNNIDLPKTIMNVRPKIAGSTIVKLVFSGIKYTTKIILSFIKNGGPVVNIDNQYVSYLNDEDSVQMHYINSNTKQNSPTYTVKYASFVKASFYMVCDYQAIHPTLKGKYISRHGMIVNSVRCTGGMHADGTMAMDPGTVDNSDDNVPVAVGTGTVTLNYGDCCCFSRHAYLNFEVRGDTGYKETSWKDNK